MKGKTNQLTQLTSSQRLFHFLKAGLMAFFIWVELVFGIIITTNILTQFSYASTWLYVSTFIACYMTVAIIFAFLFRSISQHFLFATTGLKPVIKL